MCGIRYGIIYTSGIILIVPYLLSIFENLKFKSLALIFKIEVREVRTCRVRLSSFMIDTKIKSVSVCVCVCVCVCPCCLLMCALGGFDT